MLRSYLFCLCFGIMISNLSAQNIQQKAYLVSNAHFDSQWNWDVQTSIKEYIPKTLEQNLMLLEKYPNYIFNFEGGIKYSWMKEYYPHEYELMKKYIHEGRWHITGSTWDATDTNIPAPESLTRNILYGQHYFRKEFGVESTDIFLPDCFGFGWTLPAIAAHSGLIGFSTQKLQWRLKPFYGDSKIPFEIGLWQGVDGSRIMLVADAHNYTSKFKDVDPNKDSSWDKLTKSLPGKTTYHYYGTGDTGGSPTIESVRAVEKAVKGLGPVKFISATSDQLYKDYLPFETHPELPVFNGELLMDVHGTGCYTSQAAMKLFNRRNEILATTAEKAAVIADWLGAVDYPSNTLTEAWKRFIWHQFHDDLTGTSIPRAYEFSWNDELISINQFSNVLKSSIGALARNMNTNVKGTPVLIFNPIANEVSEIIEIWLDNAESNATYSVFNENGKLVSSQLVKDGIRSKLLVNAKVPAMGSVIYDVRKSSPKKHIKISVENRKIENSIYIVKLDSNGDICSIIDKRYNKELIEANKSIRLAIFENNKSFSWPAWEIIKTTIDNEPVSVRDNVKISVAEEGALRSAICVERTYGESNFRQYIRLNEGGQKDRIDIVNEVDWNTSGALLKAEFPLAVSNPKAAYDLGLGSVARGNNTDIAYEVYGQYWADITDKSGKYGVSIMNDCKYGWDKPSDNKLRLTLLHTPYTDKGYKYQNQQDLGKHKFTYSIVGHTGDFNNGGTVEKAQILNHNLVAYTTNKHKGSFGRKFTLCNLNASKARLVSMKKAENGKGYILRFYETEGKENQNIKLTIPYGVKSACEVNGVEDDKGKITFTDSEISFTMKPYSIKSIRVELLNNKDKVEKSVSIPLELPYNHQYASFNAFKRYVNFDGKGHSFASELLPNNIDYKGISFKLASTDTINSIKCKGQTIDLPEGKINKVYMLVASTNHDVNALFTVGNKEMKYVVPYYSGFVGQWGHKNHTESYMKNSNVAYVGTHRHSMLSNSDEPYEFTYMFAIEIPVDDKTNRIKLPENSNIIIFAATAAYDNNNSISAASDIEGINIPLISTEEADVNKNLLLGKKVIERSGDINKDERAENAIDDDISTKWCDEVKESGNYIVVDLEKEESIKSWYVHHAGIESGNYITSDFSLMTKSNINDEWKLVDSVFSNKSLVTNRKLSSPVKARYVRLSITKAEQDDSQATRIYEFSLF